jgi:histidine triad (HIT) family protein
MMPACAFCEIVAGREPASVVDRDDDVLAFMDIQPVNEGHTLIVPRRHAAALGDLDARSAAAIWSVGRRVAAALRRSGIRCEGVNFLVADGETAGQEVFHVHLHVLPRWNGDGFGFRFPARYAQRPSRDQLDEAARRIAGAL